MKQENNIKIAFLGGDKRAATAAKKLIDIKWDICGWKIPDCNDSDGIYVCENVYKAISKSSAIVLPLPSSIDGITLNCETDNDESKISLSHIADAAEADSVIIGGKLPISFVNYAASKGIRTIDYFESEAFQIKNAYTTAEAALSIAMNNLPKNIRGANFAITGYGRISKQLVRLLRALDANVTVLARKESDITWAGLDGCSTLKLEKEKDNSIMKITRGYDMIFNTVPSWLFEESFLKNVAPNTLIIDLASAPGGIDISEAKRLKSNVLWAASLPGKYAPESAGELIADCVRDIIEVEVIGG